MGQQLQLRRGTTAENNAFTGAVGELTVDTDRSEMRLHDGVTAGGVNVSGDAKTTASLSQFAATTSFELRGVLTDETGTGSAVFATTPTLVTPILGTPTSGTLTNCTGLPAAGVTGTALVSAAIGTTVQAYDADLAALAGVTSAADKVPYFTGAGTAAVADFTSAARTLCAATNVAAQQDALDLIPGIDVAAYDTPRVHHTFCFASAAATAAAARTTGIVTSTAIASRQKTPSGKSFLVLGVSSSVESGPAAGTYTVKAVIYNHTDATETTLATFPTFAASTVEHVEAVGTISSPLATISASRTFSVGWANDASSPGALSTNARSIFVTGIFV